MTRSRFTLRMKSDIIGAARKAADLSAKAVLSELFGEMQAAIGSPVWSWPRETQRSGGAPVGSPRNIVDTGLLRASGVALFPSARSARFAWSANYASYVHFGAWVYPWGDTSRERVYTPPRPWTTAVLGTTPVPGIKPYDVEGRFKQFWRVFYKP